MKSTNNVQTTEAMNKSALAPTWQSCIIEDLSDDAQAAVSGGIVGPPGLADKAGTGFALTRPGLIENINELNGFASPKAGNGANSGGEGNNGFQIAPL